MKLVGFSHVYNEEMLLPMWIEHHKQFFDHCVIVDHSSTDSSVELISSLAPEWDIIPSKLLEFDAEATDKEMMEVESSYSADWKIILNTTEFILNRRFREQLRSLEEQFPLIEAFGMRSYCLVDKDLNKPNMNPVFLNHTHGFLDKTHGWNVPRWHRYIHRGENGKYVVGRHGTGLISMLAEDLFLCHLTFAPWPQSYNRKMQIQERIVSDRWKARGVQHLQTPESMFSLYRRHLEVSSDLLQDPTFASLHKEWTDGNS
jgi:hypothetical protein